MEVGGSRDEDRDEGLQIAESDDFFKRPPLLRDTPVARKTRKRTVEGKRRERMVTATKEMYELIRQFNSNFSYTCANDVYEEAAKIIRADLARKHEAEELTRAAQQVHPKLDDPAPMTPTVYAPVHNAFISFAHNFPTPPMSHSSLSTPNSSFSAKSFPSPFSFLSTPPPTALGVLPSPPSSATPHTTSFTSATLLASSNSQNSLNLTSVPIPPVSKGSRFSGQIWRPF